MVLFSNISVGQKVQVFYNDAVHNGVVKYKGGLSNTKGDWVGVELDRPGMWFQFQFIKFTNFIRDMGLL